jgi:hypothetical protein
VVLDRRDFLKWTGLTVTCAAAVMTGACSSGTPAPPPPAAAAGRELMKIGLYTWDEISDLSNQVEWLNLTYARAGVMSDALMSFCVDHHIDVLLNVTPTGDRAAFGTEAEFVSAYLAQIDWTLGRFGPRGTFWSDHPGVPYHPITQIEVCNEPNFGYGFSVGDAEVAPLYARVLIASHGLIKATWPEVVVVGFAAGGASNAAPDFLSNTFAELQSAGQIDCFDVVSVHPYSSNKPPEQTIVEEWGSWSSRESIDTIRQVMQEFGVAKPLWITEVGYQISHVDGGKFEVTIDNQQVTTETVTPMQQAAYTIRVNMAAARYDIPRVYHMFVLDSDDYNGGWFGPGPGHEPRLVAVAMRQVIDLLAGATNLEMVLDGAQDKPTDPFAYRFTTPRGTVLVAWCQVAATFELQLDPGTRTVVTDMQGTVLATTEDPSYDAALSEEPIFLHSTPV